MWGREWPTDWHAASSGGGVSGTRRRGRLHTLVTVPRVPELCTLKMVRFCML